MGALKQQLFLYGVLLVAACDADSTSDTPGCDVLGHQLAVGESADDPSSCLRCTCHAAGEPGCVPLEGCTDAGARDAQAAPDRAVPADVAFVDAALDGAPIDVGPRPDAAQECDGDARHCENEVAVACEAGRLTRTACPEGRPCALGECVPEGPCGVGARGCGAQGAMVCEAGAWALGRACDDDQHCRAGECIAWACISPRDRASYVGCDFLAVELPNEENERPAIAVVLANHDLERPLRTTVRNEIGEIAALVATEEERDRRTNAVRTVTSSVRDAEGEVVLDEVVERAGLTYRAELGSQEMLLLSAWAEGMSDNPPDLTGARVRASAPVAVFSTHGCTDYPHGWSACDHVEEQLMPTDTWGGAFLLVPTLRRNPDADREVTYWKLLAEEIGTRVQFSVPYADLEPRAPGAPGVPDCGTLRVTPDTIELAAPGFCEFGTRAPVRIQGDGRLGVLGIVSGQQAAGGSPGDQAGDPAIFIVPPDRQYRRSYTFLAPDTYAHDFVTVIAPFEATIFLDGAPLDLKPATAIPGSDHAFLHVPIADGPHRLDGDQRFAIVVFAYDDYVSYAFAGGLDLGKE